jgi:DNA-binding transcriptional ArsR family regulator
MLAALNHTLRRRILRIFEADDNRLESPSNFAKALKLPVGKVNYHVTVLVKVGALELVETRVGRGSEHFYRLALGGAEDWVHAALEASRESDGDHRSA